MATAAPEAAPAAGSGKKKLILIIAIVLLLVVGGAVAVLLLKKKAPVEGEEGEEAEAAPKHQVEVAAPKPGTPPVFLPVDPFTVNLADKEVDRYAQVGITLEVVDQKTADLLKNYMPAIRSGVLMVLSHKTAADLLSKEGKERLQKEILAEAVRPLGYEVEIDEDVEEDAAPKKKKRKRRPQLLPVTQVLFAQFIVQ